MVGRFARPRARVAGAVTAAALAGAFLFASAPSGVTVPSSNAAKVDAKVLSQTLGGRQATFWAVLERRADLSAAPRIRDWAARGAFVVRTLQEAADSSQAGLRAFLDGRGATYTPFWITNAIQVTGDRSLVDAIAARSEVARIRADGGVSIPRPVARSAPATADAVEWNIQRIRADEVWSAFGVRGEGIVVSNVDTGVQYTHHALVRQYRGFSTPGVHFDHNYNWFNGTHVWCNVKPCDNNDHGTHTMGTMVGEDPSLNNQVGVAPGAKWIAAKGCGSFFCGDNALLDSGQWILAPRDLNHQNPRPDLRPHIVNNSWGGGGGDTFYKDTVDAWVASGIWPSFSNGNGGPGCRSSGSPGDFPNTYSAGAFDIDNVIADFSSRGDSLFGGITKPNIAAPGVDVRSSTPKNGYQLFSGTSMASPHVAGTVALMWSANPALVGDIEATVQILDDTALDTPDNQCGGTPDDNNVWGEGKLDAFAAVEAAMGLRAGTAPGGARD